MNFLLRLVSGVALLAVAAVFQGCTAEVKSSNGAPSEAEYRAAVQQAADCTRSKGWLAGKVELDADGVTYGYGISSSPGKEFSEAEQARAMKDSDACMEEFVWSKDLERKYHDSKLLSGAEWEADYAEMIRCLEAAGISGVKIGDKISDVNEKFPENYEDGLDARMCLNEHNWQLFGNNAE